MTDSVENAEINHEVLGIRQPEKTLTNDRAYTMENVDVAIWITIYKW